MANYYNNNDVFLKDNTFLRLGFRDYDGDVSVADRMRYDIGAAVKQLRDDPDFGARFLGSVGGADGDGTIYWDGDLSSVRVDGESVGVRVVHHREGGEIVGENSFGRFLTDVRRRYREYLSSHVVPERVREEDRVVCDFTRKGSLESDIELRERAGERFIHTDVYRPARWRRDASLNGTTGHARRESDPEVSFQTFVCPFGTGYPSPLVVGSAAEASMLYERALRGELDWNALMRSLSERGLMARNVSERQKRDMAQGYRAQFDWMREQIATNPDLRGMRIVSSSLLVPDDSMGRSVYDYDHAPSPAHVLQRYIDNPILLYSPSENGVARAITGPDREEPLRFNLEGGDAGTVRVLVVGSDTVGGREPGAKASSRMVREFTKDEAGNRVIRSVKQYDMPFKTQDRIEADYASFRRRMDEVLSSLPEGVRVELVSGNSSSFGDSVGVGTPRMVERYVSEKGGGVYSWNFTRRAPVPVPARGGKEVEPDGRLSAVVMDHFADCVPVMAGRTQKVTFLLDSKDPDSDVTFAASDATISVANSDTDVVAAYLASPTYKSNNLLTFGHVLCQVGTAAIKAPAGYTVSDFKLAITPIYSGTYSVKDATWAAGSAASAVYLIGTANAGVNISSEGGSYTSPDNDLWLVPGTYTLTATYTIAKGNFSKAYTKTATVALVIGKNNNLVLPGENHDEPNIPDPGDDISDITFTVDVTPWSNNDIPVTF